MSSSSAQVSRTAKRSFSTSWSAHDFGITRSSPPHLRGESSDPNSISKHSPRPNRIRTSLHPNARPLEEDVRPDIPHPSYHNGQIMRLVDKPSKLPPKMAYERMDRLKKAREVGLPWNQVYVNEYAKPRKDIFPPPLVPVSIKDRSLVRGEERDGEGEKVNYEVGRGGETMEKRAFFVSDVEDEMGEGIDWSGTEIAEEVVGLEAGRIVECRRSGQMSIGMILGSIIMSGRPRLLMLRSTGEIWPISSHDVQFIMPSTLVPPQTAQQCWSPHLLELWSRGEEVPSAEASEEMQSMADARRRAVAILRKISRETERMCGRMMGGIIGRGRVGGPEMVWESLVNEEDEERRSSITAAQAAEIILNPEDSKDRQRIQVKQNTLPAYAAHVLMMRRPDLFLGDTGDMWETGLFLVRSRAERKRLEEVMQIVKAETPQDKRKIMTFVDKCRAAINESRRAKAALTGSSEFKEVQHKLPEWSNDDKLFLDTLLAGMYETRSTQITPNASAATAILKAIEAYPGEELDKGKYAKLLLEIGVMPPWETLRRSEAKESEIRAMAMSGETPRGQQDLLKGNELDDLRVDYTSHRVFVVDDATASELDDGIAVERAHGSTDVWVHVHVADPTRYIPFEHALSQQASFRGSSLYLPEGNVPLFPIKEIMGELSLGARVQKDGGAQGVMTFSTLLSEDGVVKDTKVNMGWIKNPRVITYSAVDEALGVPKGSALRPFGTPQHHTSRTSRHNGITPEDLADLTLLQHLATKHRIKRYAHAGFEYSIPSASTHLTEPAPTLSTNFYSLHYLPSRPHIYPSLPDFAYSLSSPFSTPNPTLSATSIIAEYMILAGRSAATYTSNHNIPVPYRGTDTPRTVTTAGNRPISLDELLDKRDILGNIDPWEYNRAGLYTTPGEVGIQPLKHWVMGFDKIDNGYIRATSPLRRYDDMLVHWQIKSHLATSSNLAIPHTPLLSAQLILQHVKRSDAASRKIKSISKKAEQWWQATVIATRLNGPVRGDESVDLRKEMVGVIASDTIYGTTGGKNTTAVFLPDLGVVTRLAGVGKTDYVPGGELRVRLKGVITWPNVLVDVDLV